MNTCGTLKRHKMVINSYIHLIEYYNSTWYVRLRKFDSIRLSYMFMQKSQKHLCKIYNHPEKKTIKYYTIKRWKTIKPLGQNAHSLL